MKHTLTPWKWYWKINDRLEADCGVFSESITGQAVSVCRAPRYEKEEQWEANARLIVQAPGLLEACKEINKFFYGENGHTWRGEKNMKGIIPYAYKINRAIAKAEGGI